jgi:hypothetical protein
MIYVFRTLVKTKKDIRELKPHLNELLKQAKWNFDLKDCDKILRIDSQAQISFSVIKLLQDKGFYCEELLD